MCSGAPVPAGAANQLVTFGCIDHETVQCTYNANDGGGDFPAAYSAFLGCRDASVGVDGYCRGELSAASGLSNQDACGGPNTNIAFHTLIPFTAACTGIYHFRMHADYGFGGFIGVDGVEHAAGDIWGHVFAMDVEIAAGDHYWESLGFEGCCDGHSEIEIHLPGDAETDPWRPITTGASADLVGDCDTPAPSPYSFCFGASSAETAPPRLRDRQRGAAGWLELRSTTLPVSEARQLVRRGQLRSAELSNDGWAAYEASNVWGNYPGDNQLTGTYLMNDVVYDSFIAEFETIAADNDGVGFLFGYQDLNAHFSAHEINDQWPNLRPMATAARTRRSASATALACQR